MPEIAKTEEAGKIHRKKPGSAICGICGKSESYYREMYATHWCCVWQGAYGQCHIVATLGSGPYCTWHYDCKRFGYHGQDFQEFEKWLDTRPHYDTWHHCTVASLWDAAQGTRHPELKPEWRPSREPNTILPREENLRRLRELMDSLEKKFTMSEEVPF